ncbi:MAG: hypothetical protein FJ119_14935, partial [Deltaproteobacteria bacterium]|nr:hypothetical protein [Deltaproteobacteria bacterium]
MNPTHASEPLLRVGLAEGLPGARIVITGSYLLGATVIESGEYQIKAEGITAVLFDARNSMVAAAQE